MIRMAIADKGLWRIRNVVATADLGALRAALEAERVEALVLHGDGVTDEAGLMVRAHRDLPQPEGRAVPDGWTPLADNLWERLQLAPGDEFALVWEDSHVLLGANLAAFLDAVDAIAGLARLLYTPRPGSRGQKTLYLFLVGEGVGYP